MTKWIPPNELPKSALEGLPLRYAFFDPGETTGWAVFDESGEVRAYGASAGNRELKLFLDALPETITHIVYEDYVVRPGVNHSGSRVIAAKVIGRLEAYAEDHGIKWDRQQASIKPMGYKLLKIKAPSDHSISHAFDALAHGKFWCFKNRIKKNYERRSSMEGDRGSTAEGG